MMLEEFLEGEHFEDSRFDITDEFQADWALRKIAAAQHEIARKQDMAEEEIQRIGLWLQEETKQEQQTIEFFTGLLAAYHYPQYEKDPRHKKTIKLPHGKLQWRKPAMQFHRDDAQLTAWLETRKLDEYLEWQVKPRWSELKKRVTVVSGKVIDTETGELIEGVAPIEQPEHFKVSITEESE